MFKFDLNALQKVEVVSNELNKVFNELSIEAKIAYLFLNNLKDVQYEIKCDDAIENIIKKAVIVFLLREQKEARAHFLECFSDISLWQIDKKLLNINTLVSLKVRELSNEEYLYVELYFKDIKAKEDNEIEIVEIDWCGAEVNPSMFFAKEEFGIILNVATKIVKFTINENLLAKKELKTILDVIIKEAKYIVDEKIIQEVELENAKLRNENHHLKIENKKLKNKIQQLKRENKKLKQRLNEESN